MLAQALEYHDLGLAVMALPRASKRPTTRWRRWQRAQPSQAELMAMFNGQPCNIAAICGVASDNLIGLDCDTPAVFAEVGGKLSGLGISTWTVARPPNGSPHDGGGLYLVRGPGSVKTSKAGALDVRGEGAYVLLPDSEHDHGGCYEFVAGGPPYPIFTIPDLRSPDFSWLPLRPWQPPAAEVPRSAWPLLLNKPGAVAAYDTRSEAEMALLCVLANAGLTFADALRLMRSNPGPGKFAELDARDPEAGKRYLYHSWCNAREWTQAHPSPVKALAQDLRAWAVSRPWLGRSGPSDRATYLAHLDLAEKAAKQPHGASCRELAEIAGIGWKTAARANKRLIEAGLLQIAQTCRATLSTRYNLVDPAPDPAGDGDPPSLGSRPPEADIVAQSLNKNVGERVTMSTPEGEGTAHDCWRWGALNKSGAEVWVILQAQGEATERELVKVTGRCRRTVKRRLMVMFKLGMAEPLGAGHWRALEGADLDAAARELGTWGQAKRQRERHREERALHRLALDQGKARKRGKGGGLAVTLGEVRKTPAEPVGEVL